MPQLYKYPQNDFDRPSSLLGVLGSFWASLYQGNGLVSDISNVVGQLYQQVNTQFLELVNSVSRKNVPVYHQDDWYAVQVRRSELNTDTSLLARYLAGTAYKYKSQAELFYGQIPTSSYYAVSKPRELVECSVVFEQVTRPTVQMLNGIDFWLEEDTVVFVTNPFDNPSIPKKEILNAVGEIVDTEITLWFYRSKWDWNYIYDQFGYALNLPMRSSAGYKTLVNAVLESFNEGTSARSQQQALAAVFGIPLVLDATEVVEAIATDATGLKVITNSNVYAYPSTATPVVSVGQTVYAGQSLTDTFEIIELNRGFDVNCGVDSLTMDTSMLAKGYHDGIVFSNANVPVQTELDVDGYTKVTWDLGGFPRDVSKFWEDVHANGIAKNETLAMLLDVRENPVGQPTAASLPAEINPLKFLIDNLLRFNVFIVKVKPGSKLQNRLEFVPVSQLRKVMPPHTLMILLVDLVYADNPISMEGYGTPESPGYTESFENFQCLTVSESLGYEAYVTEESKIKSISGRCV